MRVVYRDHPQADKLPKDPAPLPLLVFVHGLGGSVAQFAPLLTTLVNVGPCLSIDLPGCGLSDFSPESWEAYTQPALAALIAVVINTYRDASSGQGVIFVAHSMGCSLVARIAAGETQSLSADHVRGVVALCPRGSEMTDAEAKAGTRLTNIPTFLFDCLRSVDKIGGVDSASVHRFVGPDPASETKKMQFRFNAQSKTDVFRRMLRGALPGQNGTGLATLETWGRIEAPVLLLGGESDNLTRPQGVRDLADFLAKRGGSSEWSTVKVVILPAPASHALLFAPEQCRVVSGLVQGFLAEHVDKKLSLGWQLEYLSKEGKWDVKNFKKWQRIRDVSEPIGATLRAMKTMREVDQIHNPTSFASTWHDKIHAVVDISHEAPVYDPKKLDAGGIRYHKFPTISKHPPTDYEVDSFVDLLSDLVENAKKWSPPKTVAVHCHYGFNRTGYFIVCFLVDRMGWKLEDAIQEFARQREPGIKHPHFIDGLYVRYCAGLDRSA